MTRQTTKIAFFIVTSIFACNSLSAQKFSKLFYPYKNGRIQLHWETGFSTYYGDLSKSRLESEIKSFPTPTPSVKAGLSVFLNEHIVLSHHLFYINLKGADDPNHPWSNGRSAGHNRGLLFSTHIVGYEALVSLPIFPKKTLKKFGIEPKTGISLFNFTPTVKLDGQRYNLRKVGTFGQNLIPGQNNYSSFSIGIPLGLSISYDVANYVLVNINFLAYKLFTDYIDDVGNDKFISEQTIEDLDITDDFLKIANPNGLSGYRSNTDRDDWFSTISIGMNVHIFRNWYYRKWQ